MSLPVATVTVQTNFEASGGAVQALASHLLDPSPDKPFLVADHQKTMRESHHHNHAKVHDHHEGLLDCHLLGKPEDCQRLIKRGQTSGNWLSVNATTSAQTLQAALEFQDGLNMRCGQEPPGLPVACDGCGAPFSKEHAVQRKKGGLVIQRRNEVRDELGALCAAAFSASVIHNEPLIDLSPFLRSPNTSQPAAASDTSTPPDATAPSPSATQPATPEVMIWSDTPATPPATLTPLLQQLPHTLQMIQTLP